MDGRIQKPGLDAGTLLRVSDHFLRRRHYDDCRKYALQAHQIDPNFPGISEIVAVADVLLASKGRISPGDVPDWYEVMQLNRYSDDSDLIRRRFSHLYGLLDPSKNKFSLAKEAFDIVYDAWYVLSNPLQKLEFDDMLKKYLDDEKSKGKCDFAFWTVCPYCYYLYEYPRVYLEVCLRCPNDKCSKAFTCVEIDRPPAEVLMEGKYLCAGFLPVGFQDGGWNPFVPLKKVKANVSDDAAHFVEISDDDDEVETKSDKSFDVSGEGVNEGAGSLNMDDGMPTLKPAMGRKKSVAKKTKKVTGVGNRVTKEGFVHREETDLKVDGCENDFSIGDLGGPIDSMNGGDVEFYDADGDILVSLPNGI